MDGRTSSSTELRCIGLKLRIDVVIHGDVVYQWTRLVALESLEVSDVAAVFTRRLKVTVSEVFLAELQYAEYTEHRIH